MVKKKKKNRYSRALPIHQTHYCVPKPYHTTSGSVRWNRKLCITYVTIPSSFKMRLEHTSTRKRMTFASTGLRSASNATEFEGFYIQCSTLLEGKRGAGGLSLILARLTRKKLLLQPLPTDQVVLSRYRVTDIPGGLFMEGRGNLRYLPIGHFYLLSQSTFE